MGMEWQSFAHNEGPFTCEMKKGEMRSDLRTTNENSREQRKNKQDK